MNRGKAVMTDNPSDAANWVKIAQATRSNFCSPAVPLGQKRECDKNLSQGVHTHMLIHTETRGARTHARTDAFKSIIL